MSGMRSRPTNGSAPKPRRTPNVSPTRPADPQSEEIKLRCRFLPILSAETYIENTIFMVLKPPLRAVVPNPPLPLHSRVGARQGDPLILPLLLLLILTETPRGKFSTRKNLNSRTPTLN